MGAVTHATPAAGAIGGAPHGATILVMGCARMDAVTHATPAAGAFCGAPHGAAVLARGAPKGARSRMRLLPLGPSAGPPTGPRSSRRMRRNGASPARGSSYCSRRWSSPRGRDPREGAPARRVPRARALLLQPSEMARSPRAGPPASAFGGAPYGAAILARDAPKLRVPRMRALLLKPSAELPMGPRSS